MDHAIVATRGMPWRYRLPVLGVSVLYGGLIVSLLWFFEPELFARILASPRTLSALRLSVLTATGVALVATLVAVPVSYALSRYRFRGQVLVDVLLELPMVVSPAALGAMILIFFSTQAGNWLQQHSMQVVFAVAGIWVAQFVTVLGVSIRLIKSVLDEISPRYEHIARTLGASSWQAFRGVTLPLARKGIVAAYLLAWAKAVGEFGATITVAGAMPLKTETLPTAIFLRLSSADVQGAVVYILVIIGIGLLALGGFRIISPKRRI